MSNYRIMQDGFGKYYAEKKYFSIQANDYYWSRIGHKESQVGSAESHIERDKRENAEPKLVKYV